MISCRGGTKTTITRVRLLLAGEYCYPSRVPTIVCHRSPRGQSRYNPQPCQSGSPSPLLILHISVACVVRPTDNALLMEYSLVFKEARGYGPKGHGRRLAT